MRSAFPDAGTALEEGGGGTFRVTVPEIFVFSCRIIFITSISAYAMPDSMKSPSLTRYRTNLPSLSAVWGEIRYKKPMTERGSGTGPLGHTALPGTVVRRLQGSSSFVNCAVFPLTTTRKPLGSFSAVVRYDSPAPQCSRVGGEALTSVM